MKSIILTVSILVACLYSNYASALQIFACEPEWASLSRELSGDLNKIDTALLATQDPHRLQAKPSLIATIRKVDLLVCSGADLEIGWLPLLLRRSGNRHIQLGQAGYFEASSFVRRLEVPQQLDRALGDLHPQGNPHVHLDPRNIRIIAKALSKRLIQLDPEHELQYLALEKDFQERWQAALVAWKKKASILSAKKLVTHHSSFSYLINWLKMEHIATIENKPGISPSSAHLALLLKKIELQSPDYLIRTPYANPKPSEWLSNKTGIRTLVLPYSTGQNYVAKDLFQLFDITLALLLEDQ